MLQLKKFHDIPVSTREEARESRPHSEEPRLRLLAREEGSFTCVVGKEFPAFPSHVKRRRSPQERREVYIYVCVRAQSLQSCPTLCDPMDCSLPGSSVHGILQARILEWVAISSSYLERRDPFPAWSRKKCQRSRCISRGGALNWKGERKSRVVPPIPESPRCLRPFQGNLFSLHCLDFQAEDRLTPRWHVRQPCGKASWESLVGKPRVKATDPLIHANGSATLLLQLGRKAHVPAPTREKD